MKIYNGIAKVLFCFGMVFSSLVNATVYNIDRISHVYSDTSGKVLIKWDGSPNPGPCGNSHGWVEISADASEVLKSLAYSIYFSGRPARIDTGGCVGQREAVSSIYSPGG